MAPGNPYAKERCTSLAKGHRRKAGTPSGYYRRWCRKGRLCDTHEFIRDPESEYNVPPHTANEQFVDVWNRTVPKEKQVDLAWEANPWVWVIQFERCEKPDESSDHRTPPQAI